jgi:hypothetical protein
LIARTPKTSIVDLKVGKLHRDSGLFADKDRFVNGVENLGALVAHVARVDTAMPARGFA